MGRRHSRRVELRSESVQLESRYQLDAMNDGDTARLRWRSAFGQAAFGHPSGDDDQSTLNRDLMRCRSVHQH